MPRIHRTLPPKGTRIGIAFSGGLDTRTAVAWMSRQGLEVYAYTADLAQPDEKNVADIPAIATDHGARAARHGMRGLLQALSLSPHLEANFAGKKEGRGKIGHFTRSIRGKPPFREGRGSGDMAAIWQLERFTHALDGFHPHSGNVCCRGRSRQGGRTRRTASHQACGLSVRIGGFQCRCGVHSSR